MNLTPRDLGMARPISRRDFFDGVAAGAFGGVAGTLAGTAVGTDTPVTAVTSPSALAMRGDTSAALSVAHALRDGRFWEHAGPPVPTGESYDLVVVGAGRGGVSAAHEWLRRAPRDRVLMLDNHDRLGGRATPGTPAGTDGVMCDQESFGVDTLVRLDSPGWVDRLPIAGQARRDLWTLYHDPPDWFPGLSAEAKQERLAELTYSQFLREVCAVHPDAERFCRTMSCREWAYDTRAFGAIDAWGTGYPGFGGLGLDRSAPSRFNSPTVRRDWRQSRGTGGALGGRAAAPALDGRVRLRLSSPVVSVRDGVSAVTVGYFDGHQVRTVEAGAVILACWSAVVPYLMPDLPADRARALRRAVRVPLVHATVRVRDPRAWHRLGVDRVRWTGAYWSSAELAPPSEVHLLATPCRSELGPDAGSAAGRRELIRTPYDQLERTLRDQLARLLGPAGFDPAGDIEAITVNRWGHAKAPEYCRPWHSFYPDGPFPADAARGRFGRIAIAGSDSVPAARADAAAMAAHRAVEQLTR